MHLRRPEHQSKTRIRALRRDARLREEAQDKEEKQHKTLHSRTYSVLTLVLALMAAFSGVLYRTQIIHGAEYEASSVRSIADVEMVKAARGEIIDRYGRTLVSNCLTYQVALDLTVMGETAETNENLLALLDVCRAEGVEWNDTLPVTQWGVYTLSELSTGDQRRFGKLMVALKWWTEEQQTEFNRQFAEDYDGGAIEPPITGQALLSLFAERYGLKDYDRQTIRTLAGIYYEVLMRTKEISVSEYIFAEDVDITFISKVKEQGLPGVSIETASVRRYDTDAAAHLLGRVGSIYAEDWAKYQEKGYNMNDQVGIDGVELAFEEQLRGIAGEKVIETNTSGQVVSETYTVEPQPGSNVSLTLDLNLQEKVEEALAEWVPQLEGSLGAAAVVMDVNDGGVLACASYPTYDLSTFNQDYNDLYHDELKPMYNRALLGLYAPGSTFKMVTAVAGLETGVITTRSQTYCNGIYTYYSSPQPMCWYYRQYHRIHGSETVTEALRDSCNIFFYDLGRQVGIETLDEYAAMFGLGEYTGIELAERKGVVAGPAYSESVGAVWYEGNTLNAAIGQGDNVFTPIQLCNYIATLANGGTHYRAHLLKEVRTSDYSDTLETYTPEVVDEIGISDETLEAVKQGMLMVTTEGSVSRYFSGLDFQVGAKTGSAQVAGQENSNAVFVCFAPYDDPQVAMAIVVESGGSGSELGAIAADILSYYFGAVSSVEAVETENTLLR